MQLHATTPTINRTENRTNGVKYNIKWNEKEAKTFYGWRCVFSLKLIEETNWIILTELDMWQLKTPT